MLIIDSNDVSYTRGVVAEEILKLSSGDKDMDAEIYRRHAFDCEVKTMGGVNGFGSLPYQIKSRKVVMRDEAMVDDRGQKWLDNVLN